MNQLAGTDEERAADFQEQMDDPNIKAIWCVRGGYGTVRMIDLLDFTKFKQNPKWIIGFSDVTVLHSHLNTNGIQIHSRDYACKFESYRRSKRKFANFAFWRKIRI